MHCRCASGGTFVITRRRDMNSPSSSSVHKLASEPEELLPFRSEVQSTVVGETTLTSGAFTGLRGDDVKVSEYRLERYLNACSPTCHG